MVVDYSVRILTAAFLNTSCRRPAVHVPLLRWNAVSTLVAHEVLPSSSVATPPVALAYRPQ